MNPHGNALRKAYPIEHGIDIRDEIAAFRIVTVVYAARHAFDVTLQQFAAHQANLRVRANPDPREFGFLEVAVNPERMAVDEREPCGPSCCVVACEDLQVRDVAID